MEKTRVILIGRHAPQGLVEHVEIVEQRNVTFPATAQECIPILYALEGEAKAKGAKLLLQSTPGQVAMALCEIIRGHYGYAGFAGNAGVVISKPAEALGPLKREFNFWGDCQDWLGEEARAAILHANPQARVRHDERSGRTVVEVDPPRPFVFSHIEWI